MKLTRNPFLLGSTMAAIFLSYTGARAADKNWVGGNGNFDSTTATEGWNGVKPGASDNAFLNTGATISIDTNQTVVDLRAGTNASSTGTYTQTAGTVASTGWMRLGLATGSTGTYNISGGTLNSTGRINVGGANGGTGFFNLTGTGAVNLTASGGSIRVGGGDNPDTSVGIGTFSVSDSGAVINAGELWVGQTPGSTGTVNISSGSFTEQNWLAVGRNGSTGVINVTGGTLTHNVVSNASGRFSVGSGGGSAGTGTINQTAGTVSSTNSFIISELGAGNYNISGGQLNANGNISMARGAGAGVLTLQNGTGLTGTLPNGGGTEVVTTTNVVFGDGGGAGASTVNLNGGTLAVNRMFNGAGTGAKTFNLNGGTLKLRQSDTVGALFVSGITSNVNAGGAVVDTNGFDGTISSGLVHAGAGVDGGLIKNGTGVLTLSGAGTFTGDTQINAGTLTLANATALGSSTLNYNNQGGTLSFGTIAAATLGGLKGAQDIALTNSTPASVALTVGLNNTNTTYTGVLSGGGSLTKTGVLAPVSSLTLTNSNTFTGDVSVAIGSLVVTNSNALGTTAKTININNGTAGNCQLHLDGSSGSVNLPASFTYATSNTAGTLFNDAGNNSIAGQINMVAGGGATTLQSVSGTLNVSANISATATGRELILQGASDGSVSGNISNGSTPNLPVTKNGGGTWTLSGAANTYTGATTVNTGILKAGVATTAFGVNSPVTVASGATLNLNGFSNTIGSLNGGGDVQLGSGSLTTGGLDAAATYGGIMSGTGGLTKLGTQTLTITQAQLYTGATTISAGTLSLDNNGVDRFGALDDTAVGIGASGTLLFKGDSTVGLGSTTVTSGGTISTQDTTINTPFILGNLSLNSSSLNFDITGNGVSGSTDKIGVSGTASVTGTNTVNLNLLAGQSVATGNYTLLQTSGGLGAGGTGFTIGAKPVGFYSYSLASSTTTDLILSVTGAATPATAYWTGKGSAQISDPLNKWASGTTMSNWSSNLAGTVDTVQVPGLTSDVFFAATNAIDAAGLLNTQLDAGYSIQSLTFNTSTKPSITNVNLDTNGKLLTLGTGGLKSAVANTSVTAIGGSGSVALLSSQNWANNSSVPISVNTNINGVSGTTSLTFNGSGSGGFTLGGVLGNGSADSVGLVCNQTGVVFLNGNNTFTGGVLVGSGTLRAGNVGALNATTPNTLTFGAASTGVFQVNGLSLTVASMSTNASVGTPVVENANGSNGTLTDNVTGNTTFAGLIRNGSGGGFLSLAKTGAGSLALTNQNTYTGSTAITAGTLTLGSAENAGVSGPLGNGGLISFLGAGAGSGILQYSGSNSFDYSSRFSAAAAQQFKIDTNGQNVTYLTGLNSAGGNIQKYGAGTLTLSGTTSTATNLFTRGGALVLDAGATLTTTGVASLGFTGPENSIVTVKSTSQMVIAGDLNVSDLTGTNGVLNISDTAMVKGNTLYVGKTGTATGTVNQTGGSLSPNVATNDWRIGGAQATDGASVGIYNISAGTFTMASNFQVGANGTGAINLSGTGSMTENAGFLSLGRYASGYGQIDVNGGSFTFNTAGSRAIIGETGTGILNVRAGAFISNSNSTTAGVTLGNDNVSSSVGQVNLTGGTLTASSVGKIGAAATATFNFNGGTLKANAASATFMGGLNNAYVYGGGAKIDADNKAITIGQALLSPVGTDGVASISVSNGGSGYNTAPIIKLTGGGGTGATAVATINGSGEINAVIVTNPGVGYTSPPTVNVVNGLSGGAGATFSPALAANVSGTLTASSTTPGGVITLTGANTYTGDTTINTGTTLQLGNGTTGNDGTIVSASVANNGNLTYNRFGAAAYGGTITGTGGVSKLGAGTQTLSGSNSYTGVTTVGGGVLSVATIGNGGANSNIGAATADPANLVFSGNGNLLYTGGSALVTARGYTVGAGGGGIDHASDVTIQGQVLSSATGSFTKNGAGTLNYTNVTGTNALTGGTVGNGLGFVVTAGLVNLGGTSGSPLAQTNSITGELSIGTINNGSSPNAELRVNGGTTTITSYIGVGRGNGTNNAATTFTVNNNAIVTSGNFAIGYDNGVAGYLSSPTVNFNGTSTYTDAGVFTVGESGNAVGGLSSVNVNGTASVTLTSVAVNAVRIGLNGAAVMNQNGGSVSSAGTNVNIATGATSVGTYNLNGGTLTALGVAGAAGNSTFNFNGGSLTAPATNATFMQGLTRANVRNGGAVINTSTFDLTVGQALVHSNVGGDAAIDGGLIKQGSGTLTLTGLNTYTGATTVSGGTLAVNGTALPDAGALVINSGTVAPVGIEVVNTLYFGATQQAAGTWGHSGATPTPDHIDDVHFSGTAGVISVTSGAGGSPYATWAASKGLVGPDALATADPDKDGANNLAEFVQGGEPNPANANAGSTPPSPTVTTGAGTHIFAFRRAQVAGTQPGLAVTYEYGNNLVGWSVAPSVPDGVTVSAPVANFYGAGIDKVEVTVPDSLVPVGKRFARLHAVQN